MPKQPKKATEQRWNRVQRITTYTAVAIVALVVGVVGYQQWNSNRSSGPTPTPRQENSGFRLDKQPSLGAESAKVKIVEFGDYKCPVCKRFEEEVFPRLKEEYIDTGKIEFFFINYQFIAPDSVTAGLAGECVYHQSESSFWSFHEALYKNQGPESEQWATSPTLVGLARENAPGMDYQVLERCIATKQYGADVKEDEQIGNRNGVDSTPTVFVNGKMLPNWAYDNLSAAIERELAK